MIAYSDGGKNLEPSHKTKAWIKLYRRNCILYHLALGVKKNIFLDEGIKIINCIISLPLNTSLLIFLGDRLREMNTVSRKNTCVIVVSSTSGYCIQFYFRWKSNWKPVIQKPIWQTFSQWTKWTDHFKQNDWYCCPWQTLNFWAKIKLQ